ncbi:MAG: hypothetical protein ACI9DK_001084 [Vicingaceae bacterium]
MDCKDIIYRPKEAHKMTIENKRAEITRLLNNIQKHSDQLEEMESIPVLELEAILCKINKLHEETAVLKYLCEIQQGEGVELHSSELRVTPNIKVDKEKISENDKTEEETLEETAQLMANETDEDNAIQQMLEATLEHDHSIEPTDNLVENEESEIINPIEENSIQEEEKTEESTEEPDEKSSGINDAMLNQILADAREEEIEGSQIENLVEKLESDTDLSSKPDVNDALFAEDSSISNHLKKQPIADLMSAIGLNERYLYSNELFDGNIEEFRTTIKVLNEFDNGEEAMTFFNNGLRDAYGWEDDNMLANALFSLVERRYL